MTDEVSFETAFGKVGEIRILKYDSRYLMDLLRIFLECDDGNRTNLLDGKIKCRAARESPQP